MEVTLIFPPQWTPTQPYLGTACLAAYLKEQGFQCQQVDLNAAFYYFILQKPLIEKSYHAIRETITRFEKKDHLSPEEKVFCRKLQRESGYELLLNGKQSQRFIKGSI